MKKIQIVLSLIIIITLVITGCSNNKIDRIQDNNITKNINDNENNNSIINNSAEIPGPGKIIYKTAQNYNNKIPIKLNDDHTEVTFYLGINDIKIGDKLRTPTELNNGYLLDNEGIWINTAFLNITYQEYSELEAIPSTEWMLENIINDNPIIELYECKPEHLFNIEYINELIDNNELSDICVQYR